MLSETALLGALLIIVYLVVSNWSAGRTLRWLKRSARTEQTRSAWAEAREELFNLVRTGKLDVRSETFRAFYGLQTFIMRRPEAYDEFSRQLARVLIDLPREKKHTWLEEREQWPEEMAAVLKKMGWALLMLIMGHSGRRRVIWFFVTRVAPWAAMHLSRRVVTSAADALLQIDAIQTGRTMAAVRSRLEALQHSLVPPAAAA